MGLTQINPFITEATILALGPPVVFGKVLSWKSIVMQSHAVTFSVLSILQDYKQITRPLSVSSYACDPASPTKNSNSRTEPT